VFRLDQFFRVCNDEVKLPDGRTITIRTLSDTETNGRHEYSVAEAMRVAELLRNPESELYRTKVLIMKDASLETVTSLLVQARIQELIREANDLYRLDFIPAPDNATLLEQVDNTLQQSKADDSVYQLRLQHVNKGVEAYREKLSKLSREVVDREAAARAQQFYAASYSEDALIYYTVWCSAELNGKRVWASPEEVRNLPRAIIDYLYAKYREVDQIDPWEVTKSLAAGSVGGVGEDRPDQPPAAG
jgi:hypothetical protein